MDQQQPSMDVSPVGGVPSVEPRTGEAEDVAGREGPGWGLVNWSAVAEADPVDSPELDLLLQLAEDAETHWWNRAIGRAHAAIESSWIPNDQKCYVRKQLERLLRVRLPDAEARAACEGVTGMLLHALRIVERELPAIVADAEREARCRRQAGHAGGAAGVPLAMVIVRALVAFRSYECEVEAELDYYRSEVRRLRADQAAAAGGSSCADDGLGLWLSVPPIRGRSPGV